MSENEIIEGVTCLFCKEHQQLVVYWLPDSNPAVCHVACCQCGGSGPWEESTATAIASYNTNQQLIQQLTEVLEQVRECVCEATWGEESSRPGIRARQAEEAIVAIDTALTAARERQAIGRRGDD